MIPVWYIPSWHGDLRLEALSKAVTRIKLHDPTPHEREVADIVLGKARDKGWVDGDLPSTHFRSGNDFAILRAPMAEVGPLTTGIVRPDAAVLTVITFTSGRMISVENARADLGEVVRQIEQETRETMERVAAEEAEAKRRQDAEEAEAKRRRETAERGAEAAEKALAERAAAGKTETVAGHPYRDPAPITVAAPAPPAPTRTPAEVARPAALANVTPKAAVTVRRATPCCPQCEPGAVGPASEVLQAFLTEQEHHDWAERRAIVVRGGLTGHRYLLAHRNTDLAARIGRICFDVDDRCVMHFHDRSVPPEEEILAAKLILEHREPWLRNEATAFGARQKFKNPFGDGNDGVWDAGVTQTLGTVASALGNAAIVEDGVTGNLGMYQLEALLHQMFS